MNTKLFSWIPINDNVKFEENEHYWIFTINKNIINGIFVKGCVQRFDEDLCECYLSDGFYYLEKVNNFTPINKRISIKEIIYYGKYYAPDKP